MGARSRSFASYKKYITEILQKRIYVNLKNEFVKIIFLRIIIGNLV